MNRGLQGDRRSAGNARRRCLRAAPAPVGTPSVKWVARRTRYPITTHWKPYLHEYLGKTGACRRAEGTFRTVARGTGRLRTTPVPPGQRPCDGAAPWRSRPGIGTKIGNHTFRTTGITAYLKNGGTLENAAAMANHASTRTTRLYDRRRDEVSLDEVERIVI